MSYDIEYEASDEEHSCYVKECFYVFHECPFGMMFIRVHDLSSCNKTMHCETETYEHNKEDYRKGGFLLYGKSR